MNSREVSSSTREWRMRVNEISKGEVEKPASSYYLKIIMMILNTIIKMLKTLIQFIILSFQPDSGGWERS